MAIIGGLVLGMIVVGGGVGLFLVQNDRWERVELHPWLTWVFGDAVREAWLPMLMAGWLVAVLLAAVLIAGSLFFLWRRRQYESLITRIERELVALRNLPFADPAPFEDLSETPDDEIAGRLAATDRSLEQSIDGSGSSSRSRLLAAEVMTGVAGHLERSTGVAGHLERPGRGEEGS